MDTKLTPQELNERFHDILDTTNPENQPKITIIGLGSGGSHLTSLLARMGFQNLTVYDFDMVEARNVGYQNYRLKDIGKSKAEATAEIVAEITGQAIVWHNEKVESGAKINTDILIFGVDSMEARKELAENANYNYAIDARMGAEEISVYCWTSNEIERYLETWFPSTEANEAPCGGKAIGYTCLLDAGIMANLVKRIVKGERLPFEQNYLVNVPNLDVTF